MVGLSAFGPKRTSAKVGAVAQLLKLRRSPRLDHSFGLMASFPISYKNSFIVRKLVVSTSSTWVHLGVFYQRPCQHGEVDDTA
jgi:hypothetical protein